MAGFLRRRGLAWNPNALLCAGKSQKQELADDRHPHPSARRRIVGAAARDPLVGGRASYELGTVNTGIGLDELKRRSDITLRAREAGDGVGFSRAIRERLPSRLKADRQLATPG